MNNNSIYEFGTNLNKELLDEENNRHKQFLHKHFEKYDFLETKHDSYVTNLITLEGVIFGAVIIFTNSAQITPWLILATLFILISLIFGAFRQNISIKASYQSHQWDYDNELQHHSMMRNILRDNTLEMEKEIVQLQTRINYKKDFSYKVLKFLRLNADRVENIFIICFIVSLVFLIIHLLSKVPVTIK